MYLSCPWIANLCKSNWNTCSRILADLYTCQNLKEVQVNLAVLFQIYPYLWWLIGTKHFHESQYTSANHKTLAWMENSCWDGKHLHGGQNTYTDRKQFYQYKHFHKSLYISTNTKHPHKSQNTCTTWITYWTVNMCRVPLGLATKVLRPGY